MQCTEESCVIELTGMNKRKRILKSQSVHYNCCIALEIRRYSKPNISQGLGKLLTFDWYTGIFMIDYVDSYIDYHPDSRSVHCKYEGTSSSRMWLPNHCENRICSMATITSFFAVVTREELLAS